VITRDEIQGTGAASLYTVVRQLRPGWLPVRPGTFIDIVDEENRLLGRINAEDGIVPDTDDPTVRMENIRSLELRKEEVFLSGGNRTRVGTIIAHYRQDPEPI
jgi:hypothetical protein